MADDSIIRDYTQDCYKYAVAGRNGTEQSRDLTVAVPGQAGGVLFTPASSADEVVRRVVKDGAIYAGRELSAGLAAHGATHYPIALYFARKSNGDINFEASHYMRQNANGEWMDKHGDLPVYDPKFQNNLELMSQYRALGLDVSDLGPKAKAPQSYGRYELYGFFLVPNEGLDVGPHGFFTRLSRQDYSNGPRLKALVQERMFDITAGGVEEFLSSIKDQGRQDALRATINEIRRPAPSLPH